VLHTLLRGRTLAALRLGAVVLAIITCSCATSSSPVPAQTCACKVDKTAPAAPTTPNGPDEAELMRQIRAELSGSAPASALEHTEEAERRFGDSAFAEERRALAIQALINLDHIGAARSRAYQFLERYPNGPYSAHVAAMTGVHVTPMGPAEKAARP
jgi:hypothetical protein